MQMAMKVVENHPYVPEDMNIDTSKKSMSSKRLEMAAEILESSVFDEERDRHAPWRWPKDVWLQCDSCKRWFHQLCLGMTTALLNRFKKGKWKCCLCC
ncbi:PHD finger protein ALFIN-LIKE 2-like [Melanotaenia boesemani]|uniref:PHD finger protein ALFIN-LIKE 2-like n=1 Tax=Melanotaenia boesemani TaxID=1250792 RepID=UPI001C0544AB|nr:PHD finger protein ALFIN-LIKE 2-like [Melanotaenia boesemani]